MDLLITPPYPFSDGKGRLEVRRRLVTGKIMTEVISGAGGMGLKLSVF